MKYLKLFRVLADIFLDLDLKGMKKFFFTLTEDRKLKQEYFLQCFGCWIFFFLNMNVLLNLGLASSTTNLKKRPELREVA